MLGYRRQYGISYPCQDRGDGDQSTSEPPLCPGPDKTGENRSGRWGGNPGICPAHALCRLAASLRRSVEITGCRITRLEEQGVALIVSVPELEKKLHHLLWVQGIALASALRLLAEVLVL